MEKYEREHIMKLRPYLPECTVLLKKNGKFPLDGPCRIAAVGGGVRYTVKGGTGSGEVNSRFFMSVEDGLREAGFDVVTNEWSSTFGRFMDKAKSDFIASVKERARREKMNVISASMGAVMKQPDYDIPLPEDCDAAIYVVSRISGEGNDRLPEKGDFKLTDSEVRDILKLNEIYDKFLLVINAGGPVDLSPVLSAGNILVLSQLGIETGKALADIILGKAYPSGKLATTWAAADDYCSIGDFGGKDDTFYREGIYVGYRWFDASGTRPLFPFGHGLGYADLEMEPAGISVDKAAVKVSVRVKNTGSFAGKEAPQVYVSCPQGRLDREVKSLAAFAKTRELLPGEECVTELEFDMRDLAGYDEETASWILEKGDYAVLAGCSSDAACLKEAGTIRIPEDVTVRKVRNLFGKVPFEDWKPERAGTENAAAGKGAATEGTAVETVTARAGLAVCVMEPADLIHDGGDGAVNTTGVPDLEGLTDKELAYLNVGGFDPHKSLASVVGDSGSAVAGSAGESTSLLEGRGIKPITMADGPAGIRIAREYYEDKKGKKHSLASALPESVIEMLPAAVRFFMTRKPALKAGTVIHEQYCTAIPIATAVAQSFNTDFAELCGDIAGAEMERFGVDLWLAPAMNIHRNVLCGRNFEYYSEDPLLSGKFAAAITRGTQKHPGRGVTIKHFAANNQETNRYASNSVISERALREIYLKGFGICIRESDPMAVMTSYNLLNGEHTSESRALTTDILRTEFGFDGLVMTDWVIGNGILLAKDSKYGIPDAAKVAAAGCSLFMPGGKKDFKEILSGLRNGTVSRSQLRENGRWLLHVAARLGKE